MKKFEILGELPKCDTEREGDLMLLVKKKMVPIDLFDTGMPHTFNHY